MRRGAARARRSSARAEIEERIGHGFADPGRLEQALTHSSAAGRGRRARRSNERLEFLGDRVIGVVIADALFRQFPTEGEGDLSRRHAALVRRETLAEVAAELTLGRWLILARSEEESGGRDNPGILADALEALIGALYLDGGLAAAEAFIARHFASRIAGMAEPPRDAKTALQEWAQGRGLGLPSYRATQVAGPAHAPSFEVVVMLADFPPASATAGSKRAAEQAAAEMLLAKLAGELEPAPA
ncbi:MAG: ribonuclease III [Geminicoccaceae bacterium]